MTPPGSTNSFRTEASGSAASQPRANARVASTAFSWLSGRSARRRDARPELVGGVVLGDQVQRLAGVPCRDRLDQAGVQLIAMGDVLADGLLADREHGQRV